MALPAGTLLENRYRIDRDIRFSGHGRLPGADSLLRGPATGNLWTADVSDAGESYRMIVNIFGEGLMKRTFASLVLCILIALPSVSFADNFDDAMEAANVGDYNKSYVYFKNLPKLAKQITDIEKKLDGNNN